MAPTGFAGLRVLSLESRRAIEMAKLIETFGGNATVAPSMREVPLESNTEAQQFRPAWPARLFVGDGAGADDAPGREPSCARRMGDEPAEIEGHVCAGIGPAEEPAVHMHQQRAMQLGLAPGRTQLVRGHRHRRESRGGLGLEEAEALGKLARDQVSQRYVIGQHHQPVSSPPRPRPRYPWARHR